MTTGSARAVRSLGPDDRDELGRFSCRTFREPWSDVAEEMIAERLADELARDPAVRAVGVWEDGVLSGVAAWRLDDDLCRSIVIAVRTGARRSGLGRKLKLHVLDTARSSGAAAVVSQVHWDNHAMLDLNTELGANIEAIPGDRDYCICVIPFS